MAEEPVVYVVDDDPSMRRALERTIASAGWQVQLYDSGPAFLAACDPARPGCVVLDLRMPQLSGLGVQEQLQASDIHLPIIFVTAYGEVSAAVRAMKSGAVDFLEKPFSSQQLLTCIEQAIMRDAQARRAQARQAELNIRLSHLTGREREVLDLVAAGNTNREIATALGIQLRTAEIHRHQALRKMGVHSAVDLVRLLLNTSG